MRARGSPRGPKPTTPHRSSTGFAMRPLPAWQRSPEFEPMAVTPETARLQHWRSHDFTGVRPSPDRGGRDADLANRGRAELEGRQAVYTGDSANANRDANPELACRQLKLATGAGKTTVMAMLIAWQTINAVRRPQSRFSRAFLSSHPV